LHQEKSLNVIFNVPTQKTKIENIKDIVRDTKEDPEIKYQKQKATLALS